MRVNPLGTREDITGGELNFGKTLYFSAVLCSLIKSVAMNLKCLVEQAGKSASTGPRLCCLLWREAIVTVLGAVENLYFRRTRADVFKSNGGPLHDARVCVLELGTTVSWSSCFPEKLTARGLAVCEPAISPCDGHRVKT